MKSFQEVLDWARGYILISIGKGQYESAMYSVVHTAWTNGYKEAEKKLKQKGEKK